MDAIVPALNEESSVAGVVQALRAANVFSRVLVVDDGSEDETARRAEIAGAAVLRMGTNHGKGQAMFAGASESAGDVAFFDADLVGFGPEHARLLMHGYSKGYDMVCGLREYDRVGSMLQVALGPLITGERVVKRWILDLLPGSCWTGYSIETAMNFVCDQAGGRVCLLPMTGVRIRGKVKKGGILKGLRGHANMFAEIAATRRMLNDTDGRACKV